ncbi:MAG: PQQ-binding-like beta-propeller repeat protein, partial [Planctomycetaceae bacterium]
GWGYSESPLVEGDMLIVTPGGDDGALAALDKRTGEILWRSTDVTDRAHYSSPIAADIHGVRQIIQFTRERVVGLDAKDGRLLWEYDGSANDTANVATPIVKDEFVFTSSGYGTGGGLVKIIKDGDGMQAEEVWFNRSMANHHGGVILVEGHLYGFGSGGLICLDFETGEIAWRDRSVRKGSLTYADGRLYCLGEKNEMALVEANPREYVEKGRFELPDSGKPTWAHPVVANGKLFLRDQNTLTCHNVKADAR